ncbi:MAG: hypothetical protein ACOC8B_05975 [Gemmatimonadota bacterium]
MTMNAEVRSARGERGARERVGLRVGGALAIVGGLGYFVVLLLHGDLPDQTTATALEHIAGRPEWPLLKLSLIAFVLCWAGAFHLLADSLSDATSRVLGRLAAIVVLLGAALVLVEYSILGYGVKNVADAWATATGPDQESLLLVGEALLGVTGGLFLNFIAWLIGLPYLLMGLAVARDDGYPAWLGWLAAAAGAGALFSGATRFLGMEIVPFPVLYGAFVVPLTLWLAAVGVLMWRRAG